MADNMSKITAVLVLGVMILFGAFFVFGNKKDFSENENRELAETPDISLSDAVDGKFAKNTEKYFTDHFPFRDRFIAGSAKLSTLVSESIVNGVYVSGDRLLDVSAEERDATDKSAELINNFCKDHSSAAYFVCVPTSSGVYGDEIPPYYQKNIENRQITSLYNSLSADIRRIDAYNILKMLNENYIYYKNDNKWTTYGAYCVYKTVIQKLGFSPIPYSKYTVEHVDFDFRGNLYDITQYKDIDPDTIDIYKCLSSVKIKSCISYDNNGKRENLKLCDKERLDSAYKYDVYLGETKPYLNIKTTVNNNRKLLVIKDRFGDCFIPFLTQHYSEIAVVSPEELNVPLSSIVNVDSYEQTLFIMGINSMSNSELFELLNK